MSQSFYFKYRLDVLRLGEIEGGNRKSWKTLINVLEFVIDETGLDSLFFGEVKGIGFSALASSVLLDVLGR